MITTAIRLLPRHASTKHIVDFLINLVKTLDDESYDTIKFQIRWSLFDPKYKFSQTHSKYVNDTLTDIVIKEKGIPKMRARWLLSHKIEGMKGK